MTLDEKQKTCAKAHRLWEAGRLDEAAELVKRVLMHDANYIHAVKLAGHLQEKAGDTPMAYHLFKRATEIDPEDANALGNFGRVAQDLWRTQEAERALLKAVSLAKNPQDKAGALVNLSALKCDMGLWLECEKYARRALELNPDSKLARANLGFSQLATRNWAEGWKNYRATLGHYWRPKVQYKGEPEWDGSPGRTVVAYGEQGLGDEISFASVVPDAIKDCKRLIIDCDPRLANLFRRSFPQAKVYGTRFAKPGDKPWDAEDREFDASLPIGQLGEYYRTTPESFTGAPYLKPDPDRVLMWKSLFATKGKPVIGIAWSGGTFKSNSKQRQWTLEQLLPVLQSIDAHWVSLQYKPALHEIQAFRAKYPDIDLKEYPHGTLGPDYDDTAALVAALDGVVCMQTAVAHLAGALGVPAIVCVPTLSQWRYGDATESVPWYQSLRVVRQTDSHWSRDLRRVGDMLRADYGRISGGTGTTAQSRELRDSLDPVRAAS